MNTRPLPPSCPVCRGEGALDGDHGDAPVPQEHQVPKTTPAAIPTARRSA